MAVNSIPQRNQCPEYSLAYRGLCTRERVDCAYKVSTPLHTAEWLYWISNDQAVMLVPRQRDLLSTRTTV